jgi:hypothetical protein
MKLVICELGKMKKHMKELGGEVIGFNTISVAGEPVRFMTPDFLKSKIKGLTFHSVEYRDNVLRKIPKETIGEISKKVAINVTPNKVFQRQGQGMCRLW